MGPDERVAIIVGSLRNGKPVLMVEHVEAAMRQYRLDGIVARPYMMPPALAVDLEAALTGKAAEPPVMIRAARRRAARGKK